MKQEIFDDIVYETRDEQLSIWTQVCENCASKYDYLGYLDEIPIANLICGVAGCQHEAVYYLDIYQEDFQNEK